MVAMATSLRTLKSAMSSSDQAAQGILFSVTCSANAGLLSHHTVVWLEYLVYSVFVFLFVQLRISQRRKKIAVWNFASLFDYYLRWASLILLNFGSRGVTAAALLPGCMAWCTNAKGRIPARLGGSRNLGWCHRIRPYGGISSCKPADALVFLLRVI